MAVSVADSIELPVAERARRRITRRLMPFLLLLYFLAYIDRTNVGVTALNMRKPLTDGGLGFTDAVIGFGAGIFFWGYMLLEIPGTLIVEKWSARKWIARIMISWGVIASMFGLIGTPWMNFASVENQFYTLRFALGLAEAGFFPGIIVYLAHWFRYEDRARAKANFMIGLPIATFIGVPISRAIMENIHWYGLEGWRWVFILEGIPSVIFGIVTIYYLTDWPSEAKWLPEDEKRWIMDELERERREKLKHPHDSTLESIKTALRTPQTYLLTAIYLFIVTGYYGLTFFLPSITAQMKGTSPTLQTIITSLPYGFGVIAILINGAHSDRTRERRWHTAIPMFLASAGMLMSILSGDVLALVVMFFCVVGIGLHAYLPVFWTWPTTFLTASAAATAVGLINSFGNLGGYFGPKVVGVLSDQYKSYAPGLAFLAACILVAAALASLLKPPVKKPYQQPGD
ncbi:MAG TPA: MFS transporter [Blastocatellia bacterium]|nr:MFS transporter [Blastocatellia bacterium]